MKILTYPNSVLKEKSKPLKLPLEKNILDLIHQMYDKIEGIGVGLAAPQVGYNYQLTIIRLDKDMANKKDKQLEFVMINPKITFYSDVKTEMIEGCLSFPDQYYQIIRPKNISVEFVTIQNFKEFIKNPKSKVKLTTKKLNATGWISRVIQHEVDHLNGKLFIDLGGKKLSSKDLEGEKFID